MSENRGLDSTFVLLHIWIWIWFLDFRAGEDDDADGEGDHDDGDDDYDDIEHIWINRFENQTSNKISRTVVW